MYEKALILAKKSGKSQYSDTVEGRLLQGDYSDAVRLAQLRIERMFMDNVKNNAKENQENVKKKEQEDNVKKNANIKKNTDAILLLENPTSNIMYIFDIH